MTGGVNVIISNKYTEMLSQLDDIEVIRNKQGVFAVEDIISEFSNFYYDRMILDITAIQDYEDIKNLQKLSISLDTSKILLVLDETNEDEVSAFLSQIISMGIYNFGRSIDTIRYLLEHPNSYRDVAHIHNLTSQGGYNDVTVIGEGGTVIHKGTKVIGVKNITEHAGATTLVNAMRKQLLGHYSCIALEVDKMDFLYYQDAGMISTNRANLATELMKHREVDIVLVDLNDYPDPEVCNEVLYLIQPGILKLNKMVKKNKNISKQLEHKKVILNQCLLSKDDVDNLAFDTNIKFFASISPFDDRQDDIKDINLMLAKLGFGRQAEEPKVENPAKANLQNALFGFLKKQ